MRKPCRICGTKVALGSKGDRARWLNNPLCRVCDNYIIENFNTNGNHLTEYIDKSEYVKSLSNSLLIIS